MPTKKARRFRVISPNLVDHDQGATVTEKELAGCDIVTLIRGGHLEEITRPKTEEQG